MDVAREPSSLAREVATEISSAYLSARSDPSDRMVTTAYEKLQSETDRLFAAVVRYDRPNSIRVVFTCCREPYASDRDLIASVRSRRVLEVVTASIGSAPIHPLLGCEYGGAFDRFRAIHDLVGHARTGFGFGLDDEFAAWRTQDVLHGRLARLALATELLAINSARAMLRSVPEQKAVLLDRNLVNRARSRIMHRPWPVARQ
jgi:hypothetical protein